MKRAVVILLCVFLISIDVFAQHIYEERPSFEENFTNNKLDKRFWGVDVAEFKGHNIFYTEENYRIKNGVLNIKLKKKEYKGCNFTSSSIWTNPKTIRFGYGKLMIRAKIPATKECRPAMWLKGLNKRNTLGGEIDILEHWHNYDSKTYQANFHLWGNFKKPNDPKIYKHEQYPIVVKDFDISQWHVYMLEWNENGIIMSVDNKEVARWNAEDIPAWPGDIGYQLYLSLACSTWATKNVKQSRNLPQTMKIDWVRYYKLKR